MKRMVMLAIVQLFLLTGWAVGQGGPLDPPGTDRAEIILPEPPFDQEGGVEITVRGGSPEPGQATLLAVHNLHRRITFEIEVFPTEAEAGTATFRPWSVAARLGYLAPGDYQVVAVVNGNVVDEKRLKIPEPGTDSGRWIFYGKSGGITGISRRLLVDLKTRVYELTDSCCQKYEGTLSLRNHLRLGVALLLSNFKRLKPEYKPPTPVADGFRYEIQIPGYTVVGYSGAEIPRGFSYLVRTLDDLVDDILGASSPTPTPKWWAPWRPTRKPERPTPTVTPVPPVPTPTVTSDEFAVTGSITVYPESPTAKGTIPAVIDLDMSAGAYGVMTSTVRKIGGGELIVSLSVLPVLQTSSDVSQVRTFVDLGNLQPAVYDVVLIINDRTVDRSTFVVPKPEPPFLQFLIEPHNGGLRVSLEVSEYGQFVLHGTDADSGESRGRLYPAELEEIEEALQYLPLEPVPPGGPPALGPGDALMVHRDQMFLMKSGALPSPQVVSVMTQLGQFVAELRSRIEAVEALEASLTILPELWPAQGLFTFDIAGEFPSSNYEVVWTEVELTEKRVIRIHIWIELVAPIGAAVITPWRVQMPAPDLLQGNYSVEVYLNGRQVDQGLLSHFGRSSP